MASSVADTLQRLKTLLLASGVFSDGRLAEFKNVPPAGLTWAVFGDTIEPIRESSGLGTGTGLYVFTIRLMTDMLQEPVEAIDTNLTVALDNVFDLLSSDFEIGGTVRNVDFFGESGTRLKGHFGHVEVSGKMMRVLDITLPLIVNDTMTFVE